MRRWMRQPAWELIKARRRTARCRGWVTCFSARRHYHPKIQTFCVVAREYAIPAVMGVGNATGVIKDGQMLEIDGEAGTVRILMAPA